MSMAESTTKVDLGSSCGHVMNVCHQNLRHMVSATVISVATRYCSASCGGEGGGGRSMQRPRPNPDGRQSPGAAQHGLHQEPRSPCRKVIRKLRPANAPGFQGIVWTWQSPTRFHQVLHAMRKCMALIRLADGTRVWVTISFGTESDQEPV